MKKVRCIVSLWILLSLATFTSADQLPPIKRESKSNITALISGSKTIEPSLEPSNEEIKTIYHKPIRALLPISEIKEIIVPDNGENITDNEIERVLFNARIVYYEELSPMHLLPHIRISINTHKSETFILGLFPQETEDSRGIIILPNQKRFWFAIEME